MGGFGPARDDPVMFPIPAPAHEADGSWHGCVLYADHFGNLVTSVTEELVQSAAHVEVVIGGRCISGIRRTYADATPGELVALVGSSGHLEISVVKRQRRQTLGSAQTPRSLYAKCRRHDALSARCLTLAACIPQGVNMEQFVIQGNTPLSGTITPAGNKNAALPLLAASLLHRPATGAAKRPKHPRCSDHVANCCLIWVWTSRDRPAYTAPPGQPHPQNRPGRRAVQRHPRLYPACRSGVGALAKWSCPPPGGDVIGRRRLDTHFLAFKRLGAEMESNDRFRVHAHHLVGGDILLDEAASPRQKTL